MNILQEIAEHIAERHARWLDDTIRENVAEWKLNLLLKYNNRLLAKIIRADIEIISETLIADFGTQFVVKLNGKVIGKRKFLVNLKDYDRPIKTGKRTDNQTT